jgi:hypothetical protein
MSHQHRPELNGFAVDTSKIYEANKPKVQPTSKVATFLWWQGTVIVSSLEFFFLWKLYHAMGF